MNILITGITGLFGSQLASELSSLGKIYGLKREESNLQLANSILPGIEWRQADLSDMDSLIEALSGIEMVVHAAGWVSFIRGEEDRLFEVNTQGTANLVNAMIIAGISKLVHVSSVAAIGRNPALSSLTEDDAWVESPLNTPYALSKYRAELEVWRGQQEGLDLIVVNPSVILGKSSYGKSSSAIYSYLDSGTRFFPKGDINYIDVRDAARITRLLIEKEAWGQRFILNRESISYREFFKEMAEVFQKKAPNTKLPDSLIGIASFLSRLGKWFGIGNGLLNKQTAMLAQQKIYFDHSKVQNLLGYQYFSLRDTLVWAKEA